jgi:hypothetical protein
LQRLRLTLLEERLECCHERRHSDPGQDERAGAALASDGVTEQVGERDCDQRSDERSQWQQFTAGGGWNERDHDCRARTGPFGDTEQVRVRQRVTEGALVRGAGNGQHRTHKRAEGDAWGANLPDDRAL